MKVPYVLLLTCFVSFVIVIFAQSSDLIVKDKDDDDEANTKAKRAIKMFNFASQSAGAVILDKSPATAKGYHYLLNDDKDKYGISPCDEKKWVVIGLSEDILITSIEVSNYEKYSSTLKDFQLLASYSYPTDEWINLGQYTAKPQLGAQVFNVTENAAHTRYLKVKFLTHYSDEALCTLSQIKVFGVTVIASFQQEVQRSDTSMRDMLNQITSEDFEELLLPAPDEPEVIKTVETSTETVVPAVMTESPVETAPAPVEDISTDGAAVSESTPSVDGQAVDSNTIQGLTASEGTPLSDNSDTSVAIDEPVDPLVPANNTISACVTSENEALKASPDAQICEETEGKSVAIGLDESACGTAAPATENPPEPQQSESEQIVTVAESLVSTDKVIDSITQKPSETGESVMASEEAPEDLANIDVQHVPQTTQSPVPTDSTAEVAGAEADASPDVSARDEAEPTEAVVKSRSFERVAEQVKKYLPFEFNLFASTGEVVNETNIETIATDEKSIVAVSDSVDFTEGETSTEAIAAAADNASAQVVTSEASRVEPATGEGALIGKDDDGVAAGVQANATSEGNTEFNATTVAPVVVLNGTEVDVAPVTLGVNETENTVHTSAEETSVPVPKPEGVSNVTVNATTHSAGAVEPTVAAEANKTDTDNSTVAAPTKTPSSIAPSSGTASSSVPVAIQANATSATVLNATTVNSTTSSSGVAVNCFETLNFVEFSKKMRAKLQQKASGSGSGNSAAPTSSSSGSAESTVAAEAAALAAAAGVSAKDNNVFRSLLQKIKTLEMNSAIVEMYTIQLSECYKVVTKDLMSRTQNSSVSAQEEGLYELDALHRLIPKIVLNYDEAKQTGVVHALQVLIRQLVEENVVAIVLCSFFLVCMLCVAVMVLCCVVLSARRAKGRRTFSEYN